MLVGYSEVDPHISWILEFGDFSEDFVGHNNAYLEIPEYATTNYNTNSN
jgi:hypothetical protein